MDFSSFCCILFLSHSNPPWFFVVWELRLYHVCYDFSIVLFHFTMNPQKKPKSFLKKALTFDCNGGILYKHLREYWQLKRCESGGIGRRARLRGVWGDSYGFKSRLSHQKAGFLTCFCCFILKMPSNAIFARISAVY